MTVRGMIGRELPVVKASVEPGRLRSFRRVTGSGDVDSPLSPPTYLFCLGMLDADRPLAFVEDLGVDLAVVLHSDQAFDYHAPVQAGDRLVLRTVVSDVFEKKGGELLFVVQNTAITKENGEHIADMQRTLVIRNGG